MITLETRYYSHFIVIRIRMSCRLECSQHAGNFQCSPVRNSCKKMAEGSTEAYEYDDENRRKYCLYLFWIVIILAALIPALFVYRKIRNRS